MAFPDVKGDAIVALPPSDQAIKAILATIRALESGGNYTIKNQYSTASGAYQFTDSSWSALAVKVPSAFSLATKAAMYAPAAVQDAVAGYYARSILEANGGHLASVPITWYIGGGGMAAAVRDHSKLDVKPSGAGNPLTPRQYAERWLSTFSANAGPLSTGVLTGNVGGWTDDLGATLGEIPGAGVVKSAWSGITSVADFLKLISDPAFLMRALKVVGGLIGIIVGIVLVGFTGVRNTVRGA